jgi:hypothetical protein
MGNFGFKFYKRRQLFIRTHNETLSVVARRRFTNAPKATNPSLG